MFFFSKPPGFFDKTHWHVSRNEWLTRSRRALGCISHFSASSPPLVAHTPFRTSGKSQVFVAEGGPQSTPGPPPRSSAGVLHRRNPPFNGPNHKKSLTALRLPLLTFFWRKHEKHGSWMLQVKNSTVLYYEIGHDFF